MRYGFVMPGRGLKVAAVGPRWAWRGVIAWIAMVVAVLAPSSVRAKEPFDLDLALTMLHAAYTGGVTEEFVEVTVRRGVSSWREPFVVRIDPGSRVRASACRFELNEMSVYWAKGEPPAGRVIAVHDRDLASVYSRAVEGNLTVMKLSEALLPVPAVQVALALDESVGAGRTMKWLTPYTPSVTWTEASKEPKRAPNDIVITGTCEPLSQALPGEAAIGAGKASMTLDETTGRLKRFFVEVDGGKIEMELRIKAEKPRARGEWAIAVEARTLVNAVSDLRPRKGDAVAAKRLPDLLMQDVKDRVWLPSEAFAKPEAALTPGVEVKTSEALVLLLVRESGDGKAATPGKDVGKPETGTAFDNPAARAALTLLRAINSERANAKGAERLAPVAIQVVLVMDQPDDRVREKLARGASEWGGDVVWCSNPGSSIDRLAPDARGAVVIVRRDLSLCGVVALPESRAPSAEEKTALESKIRSELACRVDGDAAKDTGEGKPK